MNLKSPFDPEEVPTEWWWERMRLHRDRLLAASDWTQTADSPVDKAAWAAYRQALRDFPATWEPSDTVDFPLAPGEQAAPQPVEEEETSDAPVADSSSPSSDS
jgi:hypothetical protein